MAENKFQIDGSPVLGIRARLILWYVLGAVGAVVIGVAVVYTTGIRAIQETLGQTFCQIAVRTADQFDDRFVGQRRLIGDLATDALTTEIVLEQKNLYAKYPEPWATARLERRRGEWRAASVEQRRKLLHPQLSNRVSVLAGLEGGALKRLAIYDIRGVLQAANDPPANIFIADEPWFRAVGGQTRHFIYTDLRRQSYMLFLATPVWAGTEIVGYVVGEFDYRVLNGELKAVRFGDSGRVHAVDYAGVPLTGETLGYLVQAMGQRRPPQRPDALTGTAAAAYWVTLDREGAWPLWQRLACIAPIQSVNATRNAFNLPPWNIVVSQSPDESYTALRTSLELFLYVGFFGVVVVGFVGAFIAWHITTPLKQLQNGVEQFAGGDRNHRVAITTRDEIGALAAEFNRMAARVSDSENELRAFAQAVADAADAIVMTDPESRIYYVNPAFERTTGYTADELIGQTPALVASARTPREVIDAMREAMDNGRPWRGELWNQRKNGDEYPIDLTISPIHDASGTIVSLLGVHRDVSLARAYREQLEKEVEARTREIAETQGLRAMGQMASMIAHDLRNALSTIKMNLQILFRKQDAEDEKTTEWEHCRIGLDQVHYMEDIMSDMLAFARPERLRRDWHDLDQIVDEAVVADSQRISALGIDVERRDGGDMPKLYCDRSRISAVLRNLIANAIQAMAEGGTLTIASNLLIGDKDSSVTVSVSDTGTGIASEDLERVTEPFFTTRAKGTGLGLAIVKRIIGQHGGTMEIDSNQGQGTTVRLTLPTLPNDKAMSDAAIADC